MRLAFIFVAAFLLAGCWAGEGLYSASDAQQAIPPGMYRATNDEGESHLELVTILPNGMTQISEEEGKSLYGFARLDDQGRRFVAWYRKDEASSNERAQLYMLLEKRTNDEFSLYLPRCDGEDAEIAQKAGATVEKGMVNTCIFQSRADVEKAMRLIQHPEKLIRLVRVRDK
jgi:hypothetical protein